MLTAVPTLNPAFAVTIPENAAAPLVCKVAPVLTLTPKVLVSKVFVPA